MRLNQRTDYALRALLFLADSDGATASEIAAAHGLSPSHLAKVMQVLSAKGFVTAQRGRSRPSRLSRPAEEIHVGEVVRALEPFDLVECFRSESSCVLSESCRLQRTLESAQRAFLAVLDQTTLASLRSDRSGGLVQLGMRPAS
ncbi:MAG: Rrf2 family transcriptional regulator [Myxococcota bacterium]